jgi:hypothetical protein
MNPDGALGALRRLAQAEDIVAPLRVAARVRRASVGVRPLADRVERALLGRGGQAPPLQGFQHPASQAGPGHPPVPVDDERSQRVDRHRKREGRSR